MIQEKTKKTGRTIALSGFIGFVLAALLIGMLIGGYVALFVIAPQMQGNHQESNNQTNNGNQNSNNNPGPTGTQNSNGYQNGYNNQGDTGTQNGNYTSGDNNQGYVNQTSGNKNDNSTQGVNNNNPAPTNPTGQYSASGRQFAISMPVSSTQQASGTITANVNCAVQQNGNSISLALTISPTNVPSSLSQAVDTSHSATFNFAGTTSGTQFNAQASGTTGPQDATVSFSLNISGTFSTNKLTISVASASGSQLSVSTTQAISLQSS